MFEDSLLESGGKLKKRNPWTTLFSFVFQVGLVGVMILIPLIYTEALPKQQLMTFLVAPPPPPPLHHLRPQLPWSRCRRS